jgi:hypothetical protein
MEAKRLVGNQIDHEFKLCWLLDRKIGRLRVTQNFVDVIGGARTSDGVEQLQRIIKIDFLS